LRGYRVNNQLLGSRLTGTAVPAAGTALTVSLGITDDDEPNDTYTIDVFSDRIGGNDQAAIVRTQSVTGNGTHMITGVTYQGGDQYTFLRVQQADGNRAWTAPVWLEPMAAPDSGVPAGGGETPITLSLVVDVIAETARITNAGASPVEFTGWRLISVRGNQVFSFPTSFMLGAGESVTVTSGPNAKQGTGFLRWTSDSVWNNNGDPGRLVNADGMPIAETQ
jgi:hypothetical protein